MKDKIIIRTLMDTEISVLEEFVKKVEDSPKVLEDDKFVSRANFDILKGHLGTLKKMRETGWRNYQMANKFDIDTTTTQTMKPGYRRVENYPGEFEDLVKERDNWREMYDEELKKNETLGHKITLTNYDRDMKIERLKKENEELSRINSIRIGDINRLQGKIDILERRNKSLEDEKNASLSKEFKNPKEFKEILVRECRGGPYYEILYKEDGQMHVGYSSYKLDKVSEWLKEFFID